MKIVIDRVKNGYVMTRQYGETNDTFIVETHDELIKDLLFFFEERSAEMEGQHYGKVIIEREKQ